MKRIFAAVVVVVGLAFCSVAVAAAGLSGTYKRTVHSTALGGQLNGKWTVSPFQATTNGLVTGTIVTSPGYLWSSTTGFKSDAFGVWLRHL